MADSLVKVTTIAVWLGVLRLRFTERVDVQSIGEPACLVVITAEGYAHTRPDGVAVVPLAVLGP
jgi:hypothetical protein